MPTFFKVSRESDEPTRKSVIIRPILQRTGRRAIFYREPRESPVLFPFAGKNYSSGLRFYPQRETALSFVTESNLKRLPVLLLKPQLEADVAVLSGTIITSNGAITFRRAVFFGYAASVTCPAQANQLMKCAAASSKTTFAV